MVEEQSASTEQASEEQVSSGDTTQTTEQVEQPLTKEAVQQLIAEETQKAIEKGRDLGRRELQSIKDREVAEIKRRADIAEKRARAYETSFTDLDEDTRSRVEQQRTRGELDYYKSREQEEEIRRQQEAYFERLNQSLKGEVTALGIDPSDTRIDYAQDAKDYFEGRKRFSESLAKIVKTERDNLEKTALQKAEERNKQLEADLRKKYGLDSQDTAASAGVVNQSDADFMADWGAYRLPDTKENRVRYEQIKKKYY